ncbi:MAG: hypothetical protein JWM11_8053 [Planctomycetaceae bacterium]|nr:hypothetical protein [Planctomycetaceae bacterium]
MRFMMPPVNRGKNRSENARSLGNVKILPGVHPLKKKILRQGECSGDISSLELAKRSVDGEMNDCQSNLATERFLWRNDSPARFD